MEGENKTALPCMLLTTCVDDDHTMAGSMITRVTYDILDHELVVAERQPWRVAVQPWASPLGQFAADQPFAKGGVDLLVAGAARAPGGEPVKELPLSFTVGEFRADAIAIGPRVWQKRVGGGLVPSAPQPFTALPVGLDRAFGGSIMFDGLKVAYPLNAAGVGFHQDPAVALDKPLPFIEDVNHRLASLTDRPHPVGFGLCQLPNPLRMLESVTIDGKPALEYKPGPSRKRPKIDLLPRAFNRAFPALIAPSVAPGSRVVVEGFSAAGAISFAIPRPPVVVRVEVGDRRSEHVPLIDEVGVDADKNQVFLCFRHAFRYPFIAHEDRRCSLLPADGHATPALDPAAA